MPKSIKLLETMILRSMNLDKVAQFFVLVLLSQFRFVVLCVVCEEILGEGVWVPDDVGGVVGDVLHVVVPLPHVWTFNTATRLRDFVLFC